MNDIYRKGIEIFEREYEKVLNNGDLTSSNLELSCKLLEAIKNTYKICTYKEEEYDEAYSGRRGYSSMRSRHYPGEYHFEGSYAPYGYGQSNNGSYSRGYSWDGNYNGGSSNSASSLRNKLNQLMNEASNDRERMMVQAWINEVGNL